MSVPTAILLFSLFWQARRGERLFGSLLIAHRPRVVHDLLGQARMSLSEKFHTRLRGCGAEIRRSERHRAACALRNASARTCAYPAASRVVPRGGRRQHERMADIGTGPNRRRGRRARKINNSLPGQRICSIFVLKPPSQGNHRVVRFPRKDWPPPCATDQSGSGAPHDWRRGGVSVVSSAPTRA